MRAIVALIVTAAVVVWLARWETHPPPRTRDRPVKSAPAPPRSGVRAGTPGTRSGVGPVISTPFSTIQVRAVLRGDRLVGVETVTISGADPHTEALNARAEPLLREEALRAGSAKVDAVSGATYTSESWRDSLKAAIARAQG